MKKVIFAKKNNDSKKRTCSHSVVEEPPWVGYRLNSGWEHKLKDGKLNLKLFCFHTLLYVRNLGCLHILILFLITGGIILIFKNFACPSRYLSV